MSSSRRALVFLAFASITSPSLRAQDPQAKIVVHWDKVVRVSQNAARDKAMHAANRARHGKRHKVSGRNSFLPAVSYRCT